MEERVRNLVSLPDFDEQDEAQTTSVGKVAAGADGANGQSDHSATATKMAPQAENQLTRHLSPTQRAGPPAAPLGGSGAFASSRIILPTDTCSNALTLAFVAQPGSAQTREVIMLRRLFLTCFLTGLSLTGVGCFIPLYSNDPLRREKELLNTSEDLRHCQDEWERIWFLDQPSHLTYDRINGGVQ